MLKIQITYCGRTEIAEFPDRSTSDSTGCPNCEQIKWY